MFQEIQTMEWEKFYISDQGEMSWEKGHTHQKGYFWAKFKSDGLSYFHTLNAVDVNTTSLICWFGQTLLANKKKGALASVLALLRPQFYPQNKRTKTQVANSIIGIFKENIRGLLEKLI